MLQQQANPGLLLGDPQALVSLYADQTELLEGTPAGATDIKLYVELYRHFTVS